MELWSDHHCGTRGEDGAKQEERGTAVGGGLGSGAEVQGASDGAGLSEKRAKDGKSAGPPGRGTRA